MILPDFILTTRQNQRWDASGIDSFNSCLDKKHFKSYPYPVEYHYNSRGFRDTEWPESNLSSAIWCVGDSFTVGIGSKLENTWVNLLQSRTNTRCINVSLDGASNPWIFRKAIAILTDIKPETLIIHWTYTWRVEDPDIRLSDEDRRSAFDASTLHSQQANALFDLIKEIELNHKNSTQVLHSFVPDYSPISMIDVTESWDRVRGLDWPITLPATFNQLSDSVKSDLVNFNVYDIYINYYKLYELMAATNGIIISEIVKLDLARDGHHYDIITATKFVDVLENLILFPLVE